MEKKTTSTKVETNAGAKRKLSVVLLSIVISIEFVISDHIQRKWQPELFSYVNPMLDISAVQSRSPSPATTKVYYVRNGALWVTGGTAASTRQLKKFLSISPPVVVGSFAYFSADTGNGSGIELWKSSGTVAGTVRIKDIFRGPSSSEPRYITAINSTTVYFSANNGIHGRELWKTNGTAAGTVMVKDIFKLTGSSDPSFLCRVGGVVFFAANEGKNGTELWKSDGTVKGTLMVKNIHPHFKVSSQPQLLTESGGKLYFKANNGVSNFELYRSDGTSAGTYMLKDIRAGGYAGDVQNLTDINGTLYFTANDGIHGDELWTTNGTPAGTVKVVDFNPDPGRSNNSSERVPMGNFSKIELFYFTQGKGAKWNFLCLEMVGSQVTSSSCIFKCFGKQFSVLTIYLLMLG